MPHLGGLSLLDVNIVANMVDNTGSEDVALLPQFILRDTMQGSAGLTNVPQQRQPQSQMPSQAYANYAMGPRQEIFSF